MSRDRLRTGVAVSRRDPKPAARVSVSADMPWSKDVRVPPGPGPGVFFAPALRALACSRIRPRIRLPNSSSISWMRGKQLLRLIRVASPANTPEAIGSISFSKASRPSRRVPNSARVSSSTSVPPAKTSQITRRRPGRLSSFDEKNSGGFSGSLCSSPSLKT